MLEEHVVDAYRYMPQIKNCFAWQKLEKIDTANTHIKVTLQTMKNDLFPLGFLKRGPTYLNLNENQHAQ